MTLVIRDPVLHPKTRASLETILKHAREGKLGATNGWTCFYHQKDKFCAIGCLLTPAEHTAIDTENLNEADIDSLNYAFPDLLDRLGLTEADAVIIQRAHDIAYGGAHSQAGRFIAALEACLAANRFLIDAFTFSKGI